MCIRDSFPPLLGHLGFNVVNFFEGIGPLVQCRISRAVFEERGAARQIGKSFGGNTAQFAQLAEFTFAHGVVVRLALNHALESLLALIRRFRLINLAKFCPVRGRIADKLGDFGEQARAIV